MPPEIEQTVAAEMQAAIEAFRDVALQWLVLWVIATIAILGAAALLSILTEQNAQCPRRGWTSQRLTTPFLYAKKHSRKLGNTVIS